MAFLIIRSNNKNFSDRAKTTVIKESFFSAPAALSRVSPAVRHTKRRTGPRTHRTKAISRGVQTNTHVQVVNLQSGRNSKIKNESEIDNESEISFDIAMNDENIVHASLSDSSSSNSHQIMGSGS